MPRWLVLTLLFGLMVFPTLAGAQGETRLEEINVELWSEYDEPSMLVVFELIVSQDIPLPADILLRFPKDGNLVAVAVEHEGELFNIDFTPPVKQEDWQTIKIKAETYKA